MNSSFSSLRFLVGLFVTATFLAVSFPAMGAPLSEPILAEDPPSLVKHLRSEIQSTDPVRLENALIDVVALSKCSGSCTVNLRSVPFKRIKIENEIGVGTAFDMDLLAPTLLAAYQQGPSDGHRIMALSALLNIGNEMALEQMIQDRVPQSAFVAQTTQRGLASFYLNSYPELAEKAMHTKSLSMDDVKGAQARRVKLAKAQG